MKKTLLASLTVLLILFIAVAIWKSQTSPVRTENSNSKMTLQEKEKIQNFWNIYRQATNHRVAGRLTEAAGDYQKALLLNDQHEDALYYLGSMYLVLGKFKEAEQAWKRLVQVNPNSARAHFRLGDLYIDFEQKDFFNIKRAEAEFRRTLELNKEETAPLLRLGQIELIRGNLTEARRYFGAVTASNYKSVEGHFLNGYIVWKQGDSQSALNFLSNAIKYSRPQKPVEGVLGEGLLGEGDTKYGQLLGAAEGSGKNTLFEDHFQDLPDLEEINLTQHIDRKYKKLDAYLNQIRTGVH